ncbi:MULTISPECIES: hypothetical protein [unclassified Frigoribacterium]|uniref:hypothetical protein n=1 Tax=unclassified Frigoribacterium TaxID=2627005 RepID=UPI0006F3CDD7|nr:MULTISPECIES: hypothetical protein [unclassified Frigoribacterium]KQO46537.1 hypothetical protein ASF07_02070 [Frigoribacterium sp. Leaf254]KQT38630.1 hypothetical protein ASG28_02070 [Frigoribacterium sp. Leaf415]
MTLAAPPRPGGRASGRSPQQVDPLGALAARPITLGAALAAWLVAVVDTLLRASDVSSPWAAAGALVAVAAGGVVLVASAAPLRAPFGPGALWCVAAACTAAGVLSALATAGSNPFVRDDWAGIASGVLLLGVAPYRSAREILAAGGAVAAVLAVVVLVEAPGFVTPVPTASYVVVALTPLLALTAASAAFSHVFVAHVEGWVSRATGFRRASTDDLRVTLARSVQQDRVTVLNREVVPFFARLVESGRIGEGDADEARRVADSLRASLVADADATWLARRLAAPGRRVPAEVVDPDRLADRLGPEHRTALWALFAAVEDVEVVDARSLRVVLEAGEARVDIAVELAFGSSAAAARRSLAPCLTVLRLVSGDLRVDRAPSHLTLRFSYDQH